MGIWLVSIEEDECSSFRIVVIGFSDPASDLVFLYDLTSSQMYSLSVVLSVAEEKISSIPVFLSDL